MNQVNVSCFLKLAVVDSSDFFKLFFFKYVNVNSKILHLSTPLLGCW